MKGQFLHSFEHTMSFMITTLAIKACYSEMIVVYEIQETANRSLLALLCTVSLLFLPLYFVFVTHEDPEAREKFNVTVVKPSQHVNSLCDENKIRTNMSHEC
ncbi:hypothetical protein Ahy_B01g056402 isoform B [Arachis hypogaea]|uniref:Uncharacterized protein n=1 Tax=Arachis hypogaea TaxID=3818 RepID=A0A445AYX3_ARAHY|nr:hypothetical protein Ahy_B01g056402 isoform B [Arachis hypogaea]